MLIQDLWLLNVPQNATWSWRKILKLRDIAKQFLKFKVGDGSRIYVVRLFASGCILYDLYGYRVIYDGRSKLDANYQVSLKGVDGIGCELHLKIWFIFKASYP